jgi:YHS domain-containing protein
MKKIIITALVLGASLSVAAKNKKMAHTKTSTAASADATQTAPAATEAMVDESKTANINDQGVILQGYDTVAYFTEGKATKGKSDINTKYNGITYNFSSEKNKALFMAEPKKYIPQYEGWCATAVAKGSKYKIDPTNYKITDGRLFLFYKEDGIFGGDAKKDWLKDESGSVKKADANWPKVKESEE